MKINNYDVEVYLRGIEIVDDDFVVDAKESLNLGGKRPSFEKRHIKNRKKVAEAIDEITSDTRWNLYYEMNERWADCMDQVMTFYRGYTKIASQIFEEVDKMSKAFDVMGLEHGDQIVACMSDVPERLTLLLAASKCGLIVNFIGDDFGRDTIRKLFKLTPKKKLFIGTDDKYEGIADLVQETSFADKIIISLTDSLENGVDPYDNIDSKTYKFVNRVADFKKSDRDIMSYSELLDISKNWDNGDNGYARRVFYAGKEALNAPLTITYTIDKDGRLKQILHANKSYITMARFHDKELSQASITRNMKGLTYVPAYSNMSLSSCINVLSQNGVVVFEPVYHPNFLLYSMAINQPEIVASTRSLLLETAKQMESKLRLAEYAFSNALVVKTTLESTSKSEEKYINGILREISAGKNSLLVGNTVLSVGAGDLEHGELFFTPWKALREKTSFGKSMRAEYGLIPFQMTDLAVLNEDGLECDYEEYGRLVANSGCTMLGYLSQRDNKTFKLMDNDGNVWSDFNVWGAVLKNGNVLVKGDYDSVIELSNGQKIPYFMIADKLMEYEGIMSCEVVRPRDHEDALVAHIVLHHDALEEIDMLEMLLGEVEKKSQHSFAPELAQKIVYKVRSYKNSFPLMKNGERSIMALENEGIDGCYKPIVTDSLIETSLISAKEYFSQEFEKPVQKIKNN